MKQFYLEGIAVTRTVAKYHITECYMGRGFGEQESAEIYKLCQRDDVIGESYRDGLLDFGIELIEEAA